MSGNRSKEKGPRVVEEEPTQTHDTTNITNEYIQSLSKQFDNVSKSETDMTWYQYPLLVKQYQVLAKQFEHEKVGKEFQLKLEQKPETGQMTNIITDSVPESRESIVTTVVRLQEIDRLGVAGKQGKKAEFLLYYTLESGRDKYGRISGSAFISHGVDRQATIIRQYNDDGKEIKPKLGVEYDVFLIPWSIEALDKALEDQDIEYRARWNL
jgi:hypothetical protein